jgi:hypothetical protein
VLDGTKFKPTLFVGLGGNGGKIVNLLARKLRRHPHWSRIETLTHFVALDTNKDDLDKLREIPVECRFLASAFDRQSYIARKRGEREVAEDTLVTQWTGSGYKFRDSQGAGAGQIRMESRLGLYYNLEDDRAGIRRKIDQLLQQSTRIGNPWRDNEDRVIRIMLYGSVAGGTGSGGFLPMAYLLRQMANDQGWGRASVVGVLTLPTAFLERVKPELHDDIMANGYAALKELEYMTRQLGYDGGLDDLEFHFDPGTRNTSRLRVNKRPFDLVYLVDRPARVSIERYEHAVADASFLQIFSPILGEQAGEYDNYEKHQKTLANGEFAVHYGAFGSAILLLPRRDIVRYASLRYAARALREYLAFGGDHPDFRVPYGDPAFERLADDEKARRVDEAFLSFVRFMANDEKSRDEKGVFTAVEELRGKDGKNLLVGIRERLQEVFGKLDELITFQPIKIADITENNASINRFIDGLRRDFAEILGRVNAELEAQRGSLRQGRFLGDFFRAYEVSPISQRYLLIQLLREAFVGPSADAEETASLRGDDSKPLSLDDEDVRRQIGSMNEALQRTSAQPFLARTLGRENVEFIATKRRAIGLYDDLQDQLRRQLRSTFWKGFERELRQVGGTLLATFRRAAEIAEEAARAAERETEDFRRDPAKVDPDSDVAQYYLDVEVLRDDRRGERLWNWTYAHLLDKSAYFVPGDIYTQVTAAFAPARDADGRLRQRDAAEVVRVLREALLEDGKRIFGRALEDAKLDLASGLDLEQRYIALLDEGGDLKALRASGKLDERLRAVSATRVQSGIEDKLARLSADCSEIANIEPRDGDGVKPANVIFAGLDARFDTEEPGSIGPALRRVVQGRMQLVTGWHDPDSLVLYRARLGIPVYWFRNVETALAPAYAAVSRRDNRSYPLHIEAAWETNAHQNGLPNLDPLEIRRARERDAASKVQREAVSARGDRVRAFTLAALVGAIVDGGQGYAWSMAGVSQPLGRDRAAAFDAFDALDPDLRNDLAQAGIEAYESRKGERQPRAKLLAELQAHGERLKAIFFRANAEQRDAEIRFLKEERELVASLVKELQGQP